MCTLLIGGQNPLHHRVRLPDERPVTGALYILPDAVDQQQGGIHRVVHRGVLPFREEVGHQAVFFIGQKGLQNAFCVGIPPGCQAAAGQRDHGIPPPVAEQGVARQNGLAIGRIPAGNEGVGGSRQLLRHGVGKTAVPLQIFQASILLCQHIPPGRRRRVGGKDNFKAQGLPGLHPSGDGAAGCGIAAVRASVLPVFRVGKPLPGNGTFFDSGIGGHIHALLSGTNTSVPKNKPLILPGKGVLLGRELQPGNYLQGEVGSGAVFHGVQHGGGIPLPSGAEPPLHHHALHVVAPAGGVFVGKAA